MSTIGEQLKQTREARKLTIKQAVLGTQVRAHYIEAMEADDFSAMPSAAQARGFLRLYAQFLGLDAYEIITHLRAESAPPQKSAAPVESPVVPEPPIAAPVAEQPPEPVSVENPIPEPDSIPEPGPPTQSQEIFTEIGSSLQQRRELISLTLEEIERHTRIRRHYLQLIEAGDFDGLPSPVQARGMLNAYASFLDMDNEALLLRFADALQTRRVERQPVESIKTSRRRIVTPLWLRHFISPDLIFGGSMIVILLALSVWGAARIFSGGAGSQTTPTQGPSISDVLLASPIASAEVTEIIPTSVAELGTQIPTIDPALITPSETAVATTVQSNLQVTTVIVERTFLRVIVDGEIKQDGRVLPGSALTFDGDERIEVLTGSGAAVQILYNQQDLGLMGSFGEVVNRIYTLSGVETPTPTPSPTPTITLIPSATMKPTLTPRPTSTLRPSSTPRNTSTPIP